MRAGVKHAPESVPGNSRRAHFQVLMSVYGYVPFLAVSFRSKMDMIGTCFMKYVTVCKKRCKMKDNHDRKNIRVSKPTIAEEHPCAKNVDISYAKGVAKTAGKNGLVNVSFEPAAVLPRMSHSLYSGSEFGVRELYSGVKKSLQSVL